MRGGGSMEGGSERERREGRCIIKIHTQWHPETLTRPINKKEEGI